MALIPLKTRTGIAAIILAGGTLASAAASATTITFSGLAGGPVATYTEGGFTVTTSLGLLRGTLFLPDQLFGNPAPSLLAVPTEAAAPVGALDVTANGGGPFNFASVDLAAVDNSARWP
jgi:hypothetical protein